MRRSVKLPLLRIAVYAKWATIFLLWMALFDYFLHPWIAGGIACFLTVEGFWHDNNWKEHQLMKQPTITLYRRRKNSSV